MAVHDMTITAARYDDQRNELTVTVRGGPTPPPPADLPPNTIWLPRGEGIEAQFSVPVRRNNIQAATAIKVENTVTAGGMTSAYTLMQSDGKGGWTALGPCDRLGNLL